MPVSEEDRRRFLRQSEALRAHQTDQLVTGEALRHLVAKVNVWRSTRGIEPLDVKDEASSDRPEMELHRRARALGMVGRGGADHRNPD